MDTPSFTPAPTTPTRSMTPASVFNAAVAAFLVWIANFAGELNTFITWMVAQVVMVVTAAASAAASEVAAASSAEDADDARVAAAASAATAAASAGISAGFVATSTTSLTVTTGTVHATIQASKSFQAGGGEFFTLADQANAGNFMAGQITSYDPGTGALVLNVTSSGGSGTKTAWNFSLAGAPGPPGPTFTGGTLSTPVNFAPPPTIASAATTDIAGATSNYVKVSGNVTITSFGTIAAGAERRVVFTGAPLLKYDATNMILLGGADLQTKAGDVADMISEGGGAWRMTDYSRAADAPGSFRPGDFLMSANFTVPNGFARADQSVNAKASFPLLYGSIGQMYAIWNPTTATVAPTGAGSFSTSPFAVNSRLFGTFGGKLFIALPTHSTQAQVQLFSATDPTASITGGAAGVISAASGTTNFYNKLIVFSLTEQWVFGLYTPDNVGTGPTAAPIQTTDAWATTGNTQARTLTGYPTGASATTLTAAEGDQSTGALVVGGQMTGGVPFIATVNRSTYAMTPRTLPTIAGATCVDAIVSPAAGVFLAFPGGINTYQYWRSTDSGVTWSVLTTGANFNGLHGGYYQAIGGTVFASVTTGFIYSWVPYQGAVFAWLSQLGAVNDGQITGLTINSVSVFDATYLFSCSTGFLSTIDFARFTQNTTSFSGGSGQFGFGKAWITELTNTVLKYNTTNHDSTVNYVFPGPLTSSNSALNTYVRAA